MLACINEKVNRASAFLMPSILGLVGVALMLDAALYFTHGEGLS